MDAYVYWLVAALILVVVEMFTAGFAVICFALGCAAAAVAALCGATFNVQLAVAIVMTIAGFVLVRPFVMKYIQRKCNVPMNADALIGRIGTVSETIDPLTGTGRVAIDGDDWKAVSSQVIPRGTHVRIIGRESIILTVEEA